MRMANHVIRLCFLLWSGGLHRHECPLALEAPATALDSALDLAGIGHRVEIGAAVGTGDAGCHAGFLRYAASASTTDLTMATVRLLPLSASASSATISCNSRISAS